MEQFLAVAVAHFLALLIPGVDFLLIARTAMNGGWRNASGVCLGIALANGLFIAAAFSGLAFVSDPLLLGGVRVAGGGFLVFVGIAFLRSPARVELERGLRLERTAWARNFGLGLASGLLNPKNGLFYISLAAAVATAPPAVLLFYGVWMFAIVLAWDVFVAFALGSGRVLERMRRILPWVSKLAGAFLVLFGAGMVLAPFLGAGFG